MMDNSDVYKPNKCKGWRKRRCVVCEEMHYYCGRPVDKIRLKNRHTGVVHQVEAGQVVCEVCSDWNDASLYMQELPVRKVTKRCHRCGGHGRITRNRGLVDLGPCRDCGGLGYVPTDAPTAVLGETRGAA